MANQEELIVLMQKLIDKQDEVIDLLKKQVDAVTAILVIEKEIKDDWFNNHVDKKITE